MGAAAPPGLLDAELGPVRVEGEGELIVGQQGKAEDPSVERPGPTGVGRGQECGQTRGPEHGVPRSGVTLELLLAPATVKTAHGTPAGSWSRFSVADSRRVMVRGARRRGRLRPAATPRWSPGRGG